MNILVAIESDNNAKQLAKKTLSWAPRAGYSIRLFIPDKEQAPAYQNAIDEANYQFYLDINYAMIITSDKPKHYARSCGYDLLLLLPDNLNAWNRTRNHDKMILEYAADIGKARSAFNLDPSLKQQQFENGAILVRL